MATSGFVISGTGFIKFDGVELFGGLDSVRDTGCLVVVVVVVVVLALVLGADVGGGVVVVVVVVVFGDCRNVAAKAATGSDG